MKMNREFIYFKIFDKNWNRLGLDDTDIENLEKIILDNPNSGKVVQGAGGLRKLRFPLPHGGKSGGARVLYVDFVLYEKIVILNIYAKSEQTTLTPEQKREYKDLISKLKGLNDNEKHPRGNIS